MRVGNSRRISRRKIFLGKLVVVVSSGSAVEEYWVSAKKLGEILGTSYRNIENWAGNGKVLQNREGKYGVLSATLYRIERLEEELERSKQKVANFEAVENEELDLLKIRKLRAETESQEAIAKIKNLEYLRIDGKLVDADEVLDMWQNLIAACRAKFLALPAKLALELSGLETPEEIQDRLRVAIDEGLIELVMK